MPAIVRTARADEDLIDIWTSVALGSPAAADRILDAIERRWQRLSLYPFSGMARDDIAPGIRHLVSGRYLTLYRITDDGVEIVRVLHGRRKIDTNVLG